jgi:hypothetical protein
MNNEFELIFNKDRNEWFIRFTDKKLIYNPSVSVKSLINPNKIQKMFLKMEMYQAMLKWLKKEHQEFFI